MSRGITPTQKIMCYNAREALPGLRRVILLAEFQAQPLRRWVIAVDWLKEQERIFLTEAIICSMERSNKECLMKARKMG